MDGLNVLDPGFLKRMNTLLANAEVPVFFFEGDEHSTLMTACKEGSQRDGLMLDSHEELVSLVHATRCQESTRRIYHEPTREWTGISSCHFSSFVQSSVPDWFGDWNDQAFYQLERSDDHNNLVATETMKILIDRVMLLI
ncbi:hypothetical protein JB92DRAFT_1317843 [Gautieria morchelliformis]|nr:hypothetical protein JB92DRAFT_1317843 [Gautieria morchelliformis]